MFVFLFTLKILKYNASARLAYIRFFQSRSMLFPTKMWLHILFRINNHYRFSSFNDIYNNLPLCPKRGKIFLLDPFLLRIWRTDFVIAFLWIDPLDYLTSESWWLSHLLCWRFVVSSDTFSSMYPFPMALRFVGVCHSTTIITVKCNGLIHI